MLKTDGTGYGETESAGISSACAPPDWSWDNRYLFDCSNDGRAGTLEPMDRQVRRISVTDGEVRNLGRAQGPSCQSAFS